MLTANSVVEHLRVRSCRIYGIQSIIMSIYGLSVVAKRARWAGGELLGRLLRWKGDEAPRMTRKCGRYGMGMKENAKENVRARAISFTRADEASRVRAAPEKGHTGRGGVQTFHCG